MRWTTSICGRHRRLPVMDWFAGQIGHPRAAFVSQYPQSCALAFALSRQRAFRNNTPNGTRRRLQHDARSHPESTPDERPRTPRDGRRWNRNPRGRRAGHRAARLRAADLRAVHHRDRLAVAGAAAGAAAEACGSCDQHARDHRGHRRLRLGDHLGVQQGRSLCRHRRRPVPASVQPDDRVARRARHRG